MKNRFAERTGYGTVVKDIVWHPKALKVIREFPEEVRKKIGYSLRKIQNGDSLEMPLARTMNVVEEGTFEIRVKAKEGAFRVFYIAKFKNVVFVFHAFQKKAEQTPKNEIKTAKKRLFELLEE